MEESFVEESFVLERFAAKMAWEYQRKVMPQIRLAAFRDFGIRRVELSLGEYDPFGEHGDPEQLTDDVNKFGDELDAAEASGRITPKQSYDLLGASVIISGTSKADGKPIHVVAEVSIAICASDARRAAYLGSILSAVTEERTIAAVIGDSVAPSGRRLAERLGVAVSLIRPPK